MPLTIVLPNGQERTYNNADSMKKGNDGSDLFTERDGKWIASVLSSGVVVEAVAPCSITQLFNCKLLDAIRFVRAHMRNAITDEQLTDLGLLKSDLESFNRQRWTWK